MIGGTDVIIPTTLAPAEALDICVRSIVEFWPGAVIEDAESGQFYRSYRAVPFNHVNELFVYRDQTACESWEELGADESNRDTMVHLLYTRQLTVVVDDPAAPEISGMFDAIRGYLQDDIRRFPTREAA